MTKSAQAAIQVCFDYLQHVPGCSLKAWAKKNPSDFYKFLYIKIIPKDIKVENSGKVVHKMVFEDHLDTEEDV